MGYGRRKYFRGSRRFGRGKRFRKGGLKTRYRKMGGARAKLYRTGGNFAQPMAGGRPELKSIDLPCWNFFCAKTDVFGGVVANLGTEPQGSSSFTIGNTTALSWGSSFLFHSGVSSPAVLGDGSSPVCLNGSECGYGLNQRIGRKIMMKSLLIDMIVHAPGTLGITASGASGMLKIDPLQASGCYTGTARLLIVYDRQNNGTIPTKAEILAAMGTAGFGLGSAEATTSSVSTTSAMNLNARERFLIVADKAVNVDGLTDNQRRLRIYKKLNLPVVYNAGKDASISSIASGALWAVGYALGGAIGSYKTPEITAVSFWEPFALSSNCRIRFLDN